MGKLRELLQAEAERYRAEKDKRQRAIQEWLDLLNGLFERIDVWLKDSDPDSLLEVSADTVTLNDPALGEYRAPLRRIRLGEKSVEIVPAARRVAFPIRPPGSSKPVRAHGMAEVRFLGWASYYLFQLPGDQWYIRATAQNLNDSDNPVDLLDADQFEAALASLLQ